jgi:hypothetical protein
MRKFFDLVAKQARGSFDNQHTPQSVRVQKYFQDLLHGLFLLCCLAASNWRILSIKLLISAVIGQFPVGWRAISRGAPTVM